MADDPQESLTTALAELEQLRAENQRLRGLLGLDTRPAAEPVEVAEPTLFQSAPLGPPGKVDASSPQAAKLALFRSLFAGREDVHATRWENPRTGATGWSPAVQGGWARTSKGPREYLPLTDEVIARHLTGEATVGLYPLLAGDSCPLLACDFDGGTWALDALAYLDACAAGGVPAAMERSRSGNGAHVDLLCRTGAGVLCPGAGRGPAPRGDDSTGRAGSCQLRSLLPRAGLPAQRLARQPHRPSTSGWLPAAWHNRVPGPGDP